MMTRPAGFLSALLVITASALSAQEFVQIPVAAVTQQGSSSKFKFVIDMKGAMNMQGQNVPMNMQMVMHKADQYGKPDADGLTPVTSTISINKMIGSVMGKPLGSMPKMPPMPKVVTFFDSAGALVKTKITGLPKEAQAQMQQFLPQGQELMTGTTTMPFPNGRVELGRAVTMSIPFPLGGANSEFLIRYLPSEVVTVAGEQAVRFDVDAEMYSDVQEMMSLAAASDKRLASSMPKELTGYLYLKMKGDMFVGTSSGELIRQTLSPYILMNVGMGQMQMDMEFDMKMEGFRLF